MMDTKNASPFKAKLDAFVRKPGTKSVIASLICILGGIVVGFIVLLLMAIFNKNTDISEAFRGILIVLGGPFSGGNTLFQLGNMLFNSTPLIMTGLSVAIAFKTGLFNIGAPGQYLMGAMGAILVALSIPTDKVPAAIVWILALLTGIVLGALWGCIPGIFKAMFGVNEVIVCIMTNWISANIVSWVFKGSRFINVAETKINFIIKTSTVFEENGSTFGGISTPTLGLDNIFRDSYIDIGILLASLIAVVIYIMLNKTTLGYELKACGFNRNASKYAGMNEKRNIILSMAIAGALASCGAALWILNGHQDFKWETYQSLPSDGFNGIPAALLANNNPIACIFSAIFLRYINVGGSNLAHNTSFNEYVSQLIVAMIIYFAGFSKFIIGVIDAHQKKRDRASGLANALNANAAADAKLASENKAKEDGKQ